MKIIITIVVFIILVYFSLFRVMEWEQAIVFKFREIQNSDYKPGLNFKLPWVNVSKTFETRLLNLDQEPQRFLTDEKKDVIVDYYAKWRISDVEKFYTISLGGDVEYLNNLLGQRINSALRDEFGNRTVQEVVAGKRGQIFSAISGTISRLPEEWGITVVDVRTKRINLPEQVSASVYDRMRTERLRVAKDFRARGAEAAERIRANADKEREIILADAYSQAEKTRGEGDAKATGIYSTAYQKDREFYDLYRSLNAYKASFRGQNDILLLSPDTEFFKYFNNPHGR